MARTRVTLDSSGVLDALSSAAVRAQLESIAHRVEAAAIASAPVKTGNYKNSIHVEDDTTDRARVRVVASAPHAHLVEARTGNLARALGSAGV
jgi:hypothetical protein